MEAALDVGYYWPMASVTEIELAVERLSPEELRTFREWFAERDARDWDKQFEADVNSVRLDALGDEALADLREGRTTDL